MKKLCLLLLVVFSLGNSSYAQYVTIPDANFAAYLNTVVPSAMSGNQMDTTNASVLSLTRIYAENLGIHDLTGVQYFKGLITLDCGNGSPSPNPNTLTSLPALPSTLQTLICGGNQLTMLPTLPSGLTYLAAYFNKITSLPTLPPHLTYIELDGNLISSLPALPTYLTFLDCGYNNLTNLPSLPSGLDTLDCFGNHLTTLPTLPSSLKTIFCAQNPIDSLPTLPDSLISLACFQDSLINLPPLPSSLLYLMCYTNSLDSLPSLPAGLRWLQCQENQLIKLPSLPQFLDNLVCSNNHLSSLPTLPQFLYEFECSNNNISCFPLFPNSLTDTAQFNVTGNPFTCLPNYVHGMNAATLAYPLCGPGNPNGCPSAYGIVGFTYTDSISHCERDTGYRNIVNIPIKIYNGSNTLLGQTYTAVNGVYDFPDTGGTYKVVVDTLGMMPFIAQCTYPGLDSIATVAQIDTNVNFSLTCPSGFDVGVQSVTTTGLIFPGMQHDLSVVAGDMSQWYNLNCAYGDSGTVQITVSGLVTYIGLGAGALTPSVISGNNFTYHIANYGTINNNNAFNLIFKTDTNAKAGDTICVYVTVTPLTDNHPGNNTYQYCYYVLNSHDPNSKTVYPVNVAPDYDGYFTYTIHFQNTGSAAAQNILIADTLDNNLDLNTFQLINYSYQNTAMLTGNILTVRFNNINLPDSTVNPTGSTGFVQYRIKPKAGLPNGTIIKNTGYIYFDFNAAVITDTTQNLFTNTISSVNTIVADVSCKVFPNPNNGTFTISLQNVESKCSVLIYNELGQRVYTTPLNIGNTQVSLADKATGIYFYRIITENGKLVSDGKMIVE
ncbi:MAG TPA: T9SS type A sorting domain-containing protein [Bacteroidia bacterium]|jgi:uncharacterized repeat protein (TIGR01451 family)|nr:T9SS type A sorting domain-containing protein [Bacteroidia bacterium]